MRGNRNHITNYFGCTKLENANNQQDGHGSASSSSAAASNCDSLSSVNAIVTERAPRGSLDLHISDGMMHNRVLHGKQIVEVLRQVAHGMITVHENGIIHRSLSLRDIMVHQLNLPSANADTCARPILVKVGGFHRAVFTKEDETAKVSLCRQQWTGFVPPEVVSRNQSEAVWSIAGDVWCFGILIWKICSRKEEMITADAAFDYIFSLGLHEGTCLLAKPPACPDSLWQLALRCLAKQPRDRPSLQQVHAQLTQLVTAGNNSLTSSEIQQQRRAEINAATSGSDAKRQRREEVEEEEESDEDSEEEEQQGEAKEDELEEDADEIEDGDEDEGEEENEDVDPGEDLYQRALTRFVGSKTTSGLSLLHQAAMLGHAKAEFRLGMHYHSGDIVRQNLDEAVVWFRRAIAHGNHAARCRLGICYENGEGVPQETRQAFFHFKRAANNGYPDAQFHYGRYLYDGTHCTRNKEQALNLFREAAFRGCGEAQVHLLRLSRSNDLRR